MSVRLMSEVFESRDLGPTERLVMLALADHADDTGRCFPSMERLAQRTGLSERAVRNNVRKLEDRGFILTESGGGRGGTNVYRITLNPEPDAPITPANPAADTGNNDTNPAAGSPLSDINPEPDTGYLAQNPAPRSINPAPGAPEPSGTTINHTEAASDAGAREAENSDDLIWRILHALGFDRGQTIPKYWMSPDAPLIVTRWQADLGLTPDEITAIARQNAIQHGSPAQGPKILTRHMQDFAAAKNAPPLEPTSGRLIRAGPRHDQPDIAAIMDRIDLGKLQ